MPPSTVGRETIFLIWIHGQGVWGGRRDSVKIRPFAVGLTVLEFNPPQADKSPVRNRRAFFI